MTSPENILALVYDFLKYLIPELAKYPRAQKFLLADRMQNLAHDLLEDIITAYYTKAGPDKCDRLRKANLKIEHLRYAARLSHDLKLCSKQTKRSSGSPLR
ncbi:four helix bundle protein [candidate division KSB1 bacterium]|nr:four helix bundle protein [candidate division KSB1 bacterium]